MKKIFLFLFVVATLFCKAQSLQSLDTVKALSPYENIYLRKLYSDSLVSSFIIFIKKEVEAHKHITHTEHVYILDGEGEMTMSDINTDGADKKFTVKKGDIIFIPKCTVHSLKVFSQTPLKVLSVQSPMFDGKDRIIVEKKK
ncbi:MAG: cupin domain-containing protein [Bacteroidota bacterium]